MPNSNSHQSNFLGGEWSTYAQGRIDLPNYRTALNICSNAIPIEEGAWQRRSGTSHIGYTNRGGKARAFSFRFSQHQPLHTAEISFDGAAAWLRLWRGPELVTDIAQNTITSISSATPAVVLTGTHGWSTGDDVVFQLPQTNNVRNGAPLLGRVCKITKVDNTHFSIADAVTGSSIDGSTLSVDGTVTNKVARVSKFSMPYLAASDLDNIRVVMTPNSAVTTINSGGVLLVCCQGYQPYWVYATANPAAPQFATFTAVAATFSDGPYATSTLTQATAGAATGSIAFSTAADTANGGAGFTSSDIGNPIRVYSEPAQWASGTAYNAGDVVTRGTYPLSTFFSAIVANTAEDPLTTHNFWGPVDGLSLWTYGTITAITNTHNVTLRIDGPAIYNTANIVTWLESAYSSYFGYPLCGIMANGRLWLAALEDGKFDASVSNLPYTFSPTNAQGVLADNNAISYQLSGTGQSPFRWFVNDPKGILVGNLQGEYLISAATATAPITPTSIQYDIISNFGAYATEVARAGSGIMFVQRGGQQIYELVTDTFSGKFGGRVLNVFAQHLSSAFKRIEFQRAPTPLLWATDGTATFYSCTYRRIGSFISEDPKFFGWARHSLGSTFTVYDICEGTTSAGDTDATYDTSDNLYLVTYDSSKYRMEFLDNFFDAGRTAFDGHFLDASPGPGWTWGTQSTFTRQLVGYDPAIASGSAGIKVYGLGHLIGLTVSVAIGGLDFGTAVVASDGSATVSYAADPDGLGTAAYLQSLSAAASTMHNGGANLDLFISSAQTRVVLPIHVGYKFLSEGQPVRPNEQNIAHTKEGPALAEKRRVAQYGALVKQTGPFNIGTSSGSTYVATRTNAAGTALASATMFDGIIWDTVQDDYSYDGMIYWSCNSIYPMTVMGVSSFIDVAEK